MQIPPSLLQLGEKNILKLTVDAFSHPDTKKKHPNFHSICILDGGLAKKCFSHSTTNKRQSFTIDPVNEFLPSGSYDLILHTFYIAKESDVDSAITHQFQTNLGKLQLTRDFGTAAIYQDRLALLGPNAWRDTCGPLPEIIPTDLPKLPPKANYFLSMLFTILVVIVPWIILISLVCNILLILVGSFES